MDPQVERCYGDAAWIARASGNAIEALARQGDEIGLHAHMYRWDEPTEAWIVDHGDPDWVAHCLDVSFEAFRRSLGRRCASFRFGDGWCSSAALARLEAAGARWDLTGEPESQPRPSLVPGEAATGSLPGWVGIPRAPYRPSCEDFRRPDPRRRSGIWEIPLTAGTGSDASAPWRTLNLTLEPEIFQAVVERVIDGAARPYLGFMVRSDDACGDAREVVLANLAFVASHPQARRFRFSTPEEAMRRLGVLSLGERLRAWLDAPNRRS
jgi:peptidoglycan/xylan/chitin deacetylase (PgdA/CDA1 family)